MFKSSKKQNKTKQKKKNKLETCHLYSMSTIKTPEWLLLLLLILNIFCTLFFYYYCWLWTNAGGVLEFIVSDKKFTLSNSEKYIVLWAGKICWSTCFNLCSLKISLPKDYNSWQHLKKISRTLKYSINFVKQKTKQGNSISMKNLKPKGIPQQI